jgi:hypothetical protein
MKEYEVIKAFFKISEQKNYDIGDTIKLTDVDAICFIADDYIKKDLRQSKKQKK